MNIQTAAKLALKRIFMFVPTPEWLARYTDLNYLESVKTSFLCTTLLKETECRVFGGPFSNMKLDEKLSLAWDPKLIVGSYEEEIHEVIDEVICMAPAHIIDIGASYGYYAVGFALKVADTKISAFEAVENPYWQQLSELARINNVSRKIVQHGLCTSEELAKTCTPGSFVLCDCEGCEVDILDPIKVPVLKSCLMLVELHEFIRPNVISILVSRFRDSHEIRIIEEAERNPTRYRILKKLPRNWRSIAIKETRWLPNKFPRILTWQRFMLLKPKG
jgi:hypothetical protein